MLLDSYSIYGLVYQYQDSVRSVPLRGVNVDAHIVDFCVRTAISQHFYNSEASHPHPLGTAQENPMHQKLTLCRVLSIRPNSF